MKNSYKLFFALLIAAGLSYAAFSAYERQKFTTDNQTYVLPPLGYSYISLEPSIDALTMEIHYTKHHQKYVDELNNALKDYPELRAKKLEELLGNLEALPAAVRTAVRNNGGGHYNHSFFWKIMAPKAGGEPSGALKKQIDVQFGSFAAFKEEFSAAAKKVFGSGWAWLCLNKSGMLVVTSLANQDCPLSQGYIPLLGLDVWEHAYYLKYHNLRPDYIGAWWNVVQWKQVEENYTRALEGELPVLALK